jgi:hypothetical protein
MKKIWLIVFVLLLLPIAVSARSGCCSHHGGVCGCGCCDGTSLSATCAPYYPECSGSSASNNSDTPVETVKEVIPTCPSLSSYNSVSKTCVCVAGYAASTDYYGKEICITKDAKCKEVNGPNWKYNNLTGKCGCSDGYELSGSACLVKKIIVNTSNASSTKTVVKQIKTVLKQYAVAKTSVNVRKSPSATAQIIGKTKANTKYEITDLSNKNWVKIKFNGKEGFVSMGVVKVAR